MTNPANYNEVVKALIDAEALADLYYELCQAHDILSDSEPEESEHRTQLWDSVNDVMNRIVEA